MPAFAKELGIDLVIKDIKACPEAAVDFPLMKGPSLKMTNGFCLTETIAITNYMTAVAKSVLGGSSDEEKATITQWLSFINCDVSTAGYTILFATNDEQKVTQMAQLTKSLDYVENHLTKTSFLTGSEYRSCDIFAAHTIGSFLGFFGLGEKYPVIGKWVSAVARASPAMAEISAQAANTHS